MSYLADTNILLRYLEPKTLMCQQAMAALDAIWATGEIVWIVPQNIVEFWGPATRPLASNGFGLTPIEADLEASRIESIFPMAPDSQEIYIEWRRLVSANSVSGAQVHDARLAAATIVHGISHVLTFNVADFARFAEVSAVHPANVVRPA